ncbi:MAG: PQQ-binding-like beta-propeller repeat protein [Ignavibacteriales bacterium]|nr:PQQ-binding-like beta-propeller repeat protein [Ignavibacteriales bacterium]
MKYRQTKIFILLSVSVWLISCTQPIAFKYMSPSEPGYFMFGKNPERSFYENISINEELQSKWSEETSGSQSNTSIVIYKNILFVTDLSGKVYAFDSENGKQLGYEKYSGAIPVAPVINNLRMFLILNNLNERYSTLKIFDFINGKILNEFKINGSVQNEMLKMKDGIIVLTDLGELIKYNLVGTKEWSTATKVNSKSSPSSNGEVILFGNENGELVAASAKNGEIKYRSKLSDGIEGDICIDGNNSYFGDNKGRLFSININDGTINWQFDSKNKIMVTPVHDNSKIIFGNLAGDIFCLNKIDGKLIWKTRTSGVINTTPLLFKNFLVQPDVNKKVYLISTVTGKIEKTYDFERRVKLSPVYYNGILYLGSDKGMINAYKTSLND